MPTSDPESRPSNPTCRPRIPIQRPKMDGMKSESVVDILWNEWTA
jgi:hypothetical protein